MSIKLLIDMNLSPDWVNILEDEGWPALHWSTVGAPNATDRTIMDWAATNRYVVFTHDLDFGTALALTHKIGPSVIQIRGQNILPNCAKSLLVAVLKEHESDLEAGALIVIEESRKRVRILPI